jgi:hypothetical protein
MYIVNLSAKDANGDCKYFNIEVNCNNDDLAVNKAIAYFYQKYWTNTEWRKEEYEREIAFFKNKLSELSDSTLLKKIPNKNQIIDEYSRELRNYLGSTDKSIEEFSKMSLSSKIEYLLDIGCELNYFVYYKKTKFEKVYIET